MHQIYNLLIKSGVDADKAATLADYIHEATQSPNPTATQVELLDYLHSLIQN